MGDTRVVADPDDGVVTPEGVKERGPEAFATLARLRDLHVVADGEGFASYVGVDGPTWCLVHESMWPGPSTAEDELRSCTTLTRFATESEVREACNQLPLPKVLAWPGRPVKRLGPRGAFRFSWSAPMVGSGVTVKGWIRDGHPEVRLVEVEADREVRRRTRRLAPATWARFQHELSLLRADEWNEYLPNATDGSQWSFESSDGAVRCASGGINAYPPDGVAFSPTAEFGRLVLALERLVGQALWDEVPRALAITEIPDARDRIEQALLGAVRSWGRSAEAERLDPATLNEVAFEKALLPHLAELAAARRQVTVRDALPTWPGVGGLDISIDDVDHPAWVELKWAKDAETLNNCLWDAAKVALAVREGRARSGYLLAGAPRVEWQKESSPTRLFTVNVYPGDTLVSNHASWWAAWAAQKNYPRSLPAPLLITPVGATDVDHPAGPWRIAIVRVEAPGVATYDPNVIGGRAT